MKAVHEEFQRVTHPLKTFVHECCNSQPDLKIKDDDFMDIYKNWCEKNGFKQQSVNKVTADLKQMGLEKKRLRDGDRFYFFVGIQIEL